MKTIIQLWDFTSCYVGNGLLRITYTSPKTWKKWEAEIFDDRIRNAQIYDMKITLRELNDIKTIIKRKHNEREARHIAINESRTGR